MSGYKKREDLIKENEELQARVEELEAQISSAVGCGRCGEVEALRARVNELEQVLEQREKGAIPHQKEADLESALTGSLRVVVTQLRTFARTGNLDALARAEVAMRRSVMELMRR